MEEGIARFRRTVTCLSIFYEVLEVFRRLIVVMIIGMSNSPLFLFLEESAKWCLEIAICDAG